MKYNYIIDFTKLTDKNKTKAKQPQVKILNCRVVR